MLDIIADLHLHSKYSRAVSPQMNLFSMSEVARQKGIDILATGDWTHPLWTAEIKSKLVESEEGLYSLKEENETRFLLSTEVATIFSQKGKGKRIHQLIFAPDIVTVEKINKEFKKRGFNLVSDGRPILGISSKNLLELILEIDERCLLIPAHIWTPWFGVYGQMSGFDSLEEAYEDMAQYVYGIETGLSSDPEMNWQMKELNTRSILSFSDAHSLAKMGREVTIFGLESLSYENIRQAIIQPSLVASKQSLVKDQKLKTQDKVLSTIEFYPEEGKYHYSGHRKCGISQTPSEQILSKSICPICGRKVTDGVMRRVEELSEYKNTAKKKNEDGIVWIEDKNNIHPPFVRIVPLNEIIAQAIGSPVESPRVKFIFDNFLKKGLSEFDVLLRLNKEKIEDALKLITNSEKARKIADGIEKVRSEKLSIEPGFDGLYGTVKIWENNSNQTKFKQKINQITLDI
ncbi:MAG TPA: endonuclease Q family protein [Patescibacteria group bacterium]